MSSSHTQIPYLWAFQDIKTLITVFKEIIIRNTKNHTKPQKPRVSGVFRIFLCAGMPALRC